MQVKGGNFQVLDSNSTLVGYWLAADVGGTLHDWFARDASQTMSTPLDMQNHTLKYVASEQTWYASSSTWDVAKWGSEFESFLDGKFNGSKNWKKLDAYKVTKISW